MRADPDHLERLARSVADGDSIDWDAFDADSLAEQGSDLGALRLLQKLAEVHREESVGERSLEWGCLELSRKVGEGSFGEVFQAWDPKLERDVALKLHREEGVPAPKVLAEARLMARVDHPNVVRVYGVDEHDGRHGIWMEWIDGLTLHSWVKERGSFGAEEASVIAAEVCRGLAALHAEGIVHRDVKAHNVMREQGGRIVVMDLGSGCHESTDLREAGLSGTPLYMAPEQLLEGHFSVETDIYSVGVLIFFLVTGRYPFEGESIADLENAHRWGKRRLLAELRPDLPVPFVWVVEKALAAKPVERFQSAAELEAALRQGQGERGTPDGHPKPRPRRGPMNWIVPAAVAAAVVLSVFGFWFLSRPTGAPPIRLEATLMRFEAGRLEPLIKGERLSYGDALSLTVKTSQDSYVYVINEDASGVAGALFPDTGFRAANPLKADVSHTLPGINSLGDTKAWSINHPGGRECFIVVASARPLASLEAEMAALPRPSDGRPVSDAEVGQAQVRLRSALGLVSIDPQRSGPALSLCRMVEEMGTELEDEISIRRFDFLGDPQP